MILPHYNAKWSSFQRFTIRNHENRAQLLQIRKAGEILRKFPENRSNNALATVVACYCIVIPRFPNCGTSTRATSASEHKLFEPCSVLIACLQSCAPLLTEYFCFLQKIRTRILRKHCLAGPSTFSLRHRSANVCPETKSAISFWNPDFDYLSVAETDADLISALRSLKLVDYKKLSSYGTVFVFDRSFFSQRPSW